MAAKSNKEVTSKAAATAAAKTLRDPGASRAAKSAAGSALDSAPQSQKRTGSFRT